MKWILLSWLLLIVLPVLGQEDAVCFVTSVKGEVRSPDQKLLKAGDTISYGRIKNLLCYSNEGMVTLYHPKAGSFRAYTKGAYQPEEKEGLIQFTKDILLLKGKSIPLSSRGDCTCAIVDECIATDAQINSRLLIFDTLSFPVDADAKYYDSCFYFLQWKNNGQVYSNKLTISNDNVIIAPQDLFFNGKYYNKSGSEALSLGICKMRQGKKTFNLIAKVNFNWMEPLVLQTYYQTLQKAMAGHTAKDIYQTYYSDVYLFFGKPDRCHLNQLIHYHD